MLVPQTLRLVAASMLACRRRRRPAVTVTVTKLRENFPKRECRIVVQLAMINLCSDIDREMNIVCRLPSRVEQRIYNKMV